MDAPGIKKAFDASTKWDVVEIVSKLYLGGMAENARRILMWTTDQNPFPIIRILWNRDILW